MAKGRKLGKDKTARLTEDLIVEILVKLPVKTLLRFRCVCKSWYDLIKNPYFIERHLIKNQVTSTENNSILIFHGRHLTSSLLSYHSYESLSVISPHFEIPYFSELFLEISGTCNGLLCMSNGKTIVLCNPAMREFKLLPPRPFPCPEGYGVSISPIGLGFDSSTNDYKVVAFVHLLQDGGWNHIDKVEIYNLSTNSWREIEHQHDLTEMATASGASFNGALHWITQRKGDTPSSRGSNFVLCFDMSNEVFRDMELPDDQLVLPQSPLVLPDGQMFNRGKLKSLVVLNALAMFAYTDAFYDFELCFEIWVA